MDLFDYMAEKKKETQAPLALRMRPRTLEEVVGQEQSSAQINFCIVQLRRIS